jgi:hypothetical protein
MPLAQPISGSLILDESECISMIENMPLDKLRDFLESA